MVMPYQMLVDAVRGRAPIILGEHIRDDQFQPATIDLRLGDTIHAIGASFLPRPGISVADYIGKVSQYSFHLSRDKTHHLDVGKTYIVPLAESCAFPDQTRMFLSNRIHTLTALLGVFGADCGSKSPRARSTWVYVRDSV